jgi:hypothetical protein
MRKRIRRRVCQKARVMSASAELIRHPAAGCEAIRRIGVEASRAGVTLELSFRIEGDVSRLEMPAAGAPQRADGLWHHSCFEAFLQAEGGEAYVELNFSPSGAWAAYRFSARRSGRESPGLTAPRMEVRRGPDWLAMTIQISLAAIAEFAGRPIAAGLAAVIEDRHGALSWWALDHRAAAPDFHDPATFTLRLPA